MERILEDEVRMFLSSELFLFDRWRGNSNVISPLLYEYMGRWMLNGSYYIRSDFDLENDSSIISNVGFNRPCVTLNSNWNQR